MTPGCNLLRKLSRLLCAAALLTPLATPAAGDPAEGRKLVETAKCERCHLGKAGDAKAIYLRKDRKVTSWEKLKAQVATCNSQLSLGLFPEDEEHIAAYLNQTYYKFTLK